MSEIHSMGLAMAMYRQTRKIEPCEQSRDKEREQPKPKKTRKEFQPTTSQIVDIIA